MSFGGNLAKDAAAAELEKAMARMSIPVDDDMDDQPTATAVAAEIESIASSADSMIPTLNLILNPNPKLDLIPKLITVATPPDTHPRYRDPPPPPHTHAPPHTQTPTPVCRSVVLLAAKKQRP
jgi:hypothetical protein